LARNARHLWLGRLRDDSCVAVDRVPPLVLRRRHPGALAVCFHDLAGAGRLPPARPLRFSLPDLLDARAVPSALRHPVLPVAKRTVKSRTATAALSLTLHKTPLKFFRS